MNVTVAKNLTEATGKEGLLWLREGTVAGLGGHGHVTAISKKQRERQMLVLSFHL